MTAAYRLIFTDLVTDQLLDVFPATQLEFEDWIGKTGQLSAQIALPDVQTAARVRSATIPARTAVWVERDREIWWGGIVWQRTPTSASRNEPMALTLQAATFDSYLARRELDVPLPAFVQTDQLAIAQALLAKAQEVPGADIGLVAIGDAVSGVLRDRTYEWHDLPRYLDILDQLSRVENGFEWRVRGRRDESGRRVRELLLGYPRIRSAYSEIVLDHPGPVVWYKLPEDASGKATHWISRGATPTPKGDETTYPLISQPLPFLAAIEDGWPRLDGSSDYLTVERIATLDEHARHDLADAWNTAPIPEVTVQLDATPITPAMLGATIRLRIHDAWHPDGTSMHYRLVGMAITPPDRTTPETARLYLNAT
ncbi:hypothetical protein MOV08_21035 [Streptomyces yunnanensis]|uniref:Phage tail protein n=1 Tax=Streptomyces yunnanensis TaxID=156453 RepID=A0ABY8ACX5_9ACTN|nr:hypothetical protein [Streptomyces yunnanensis]WEB41507.1 hypothetical protein MOV08_21035 [Streptomyces yunnanensis]